MAADINKQRERHEFRGSGFTCEVCGAPFEHDAHKTYQHPDAEPLASKTPRKYSAMENGKPVCPKEGCGSTDLASNATGYLCRKCKTQWEKSDIEKFSEFAKDSRGQELRHGDRVRTAYGDEGVVDDVSGSDIGVDLDLGQYIDVPARELTKMSVTMATDIDGREIHRGDKIRVVTSGATGEVLSVNPSQVNYYRETPGNDNDHTSQPSCHPKKCKVIGYEVHSALSYETSATCPYCSKTVSMSRGVLGDHRDASGGCLGANRAVARFDTRGRAVFALSDFPSSIDKGGHYWKPTGKTGTRTAPGIAGEPVAEYRAVQDGHVFYAWFTPRGELRGNVSVG